MTHADITKSLQDLTDGLYYISESERPVEILEWGGVNDAELRSQIAAFTGQPESAFIQSGTATFFEGVQRMADPVDEPMMEYAKRYSALQDFLQHNLTGLNVIKAGHIEVHVFITGYTHDDHQAIVLHTIAIQT